MCSAAVHLLVVVFNNGDVIVVDVAAATTFGDRPVKRKEKSCKLLTSPSLKI